jgi:hypothetical protein
MQNAKFRMQNYGIAGATIKKSPAAKAAGRKFFSRSGVG